MAAPMESGETSSEDEETLAKLKEAAVEAPTLTKASCSSTVNGRSDKRQNIVEETSLRPDKQKATECSNSLILETTPGIRKHIAKKLSSVLDSEIDTTERCFCPSSEHAPSDSSGVRLFYRSQRYLTTEEDEKEITKKPKRKRPPSPSTDDSSEDEKLKAAAVSHDFVISQSSQPFYSDNKPPDVTVIANDGPTQQKALLESSKSHVVAKNSNVDNSVPGDSFKNTSVNDPVHKKKKKKKHKNRKSSEEG